MNMQFVLRTAIVVMAMAPLPAMAQTTSIESITGVSASPVAIESSREPAGEPTEETTISVQSLLPVEIPLNEPAPVDLNALSITGVSPELTGGVTVKAFARHVEYEGQRIGQLVLTGVEKDGMSEELPANLFNAQFNLTEPRLTPGQDVVVEGDKATLVAALEKLVADEQAEDDDRERKNPEVTETQNASGAGTNSNSGEGNDLAGAYQSPQALPPAREAAEGSNVTTAGCTVRIDVPQMKAFQQSRTESVRDGVITGSSECSDDLGSAFPLQKSFAACQDAIIDLEGMTATAQYLLFYTDSGAARQEVSECTGDEEKVFPIIEKACAIFLDYSVPEAVPQASLVYENASNVEVQVRGCTSSTTAAAVTMTETTAGCTMRHDFAGGVSHEQAIHVYELDGIQYQAGACTDTEQTYRHARVYEDLAGQPLCSPIVNLAGGSVTRQSRLQITLPTGGRFISDCSPDTASQSLVATTDGCASPASWTHDLTAGQSYGQHRFYFMADGTRDYVTQCLQSEAVYTHQIETTGWQDHDDDLYAYPLSSIYITPPGGRHDLVTNQVLQGATQMPYELTGTEVRENGNVSYEGCGRFTQTSNTQLWRRPDGGVFHKVIGPGAALGPVPACTTEITERWTKISETHTWGGCVSHLYQEREHPNRDNQGRLVTRAAKSYRWERDAVYQGRRLVTREDGTVITDETASRPFRSNSPCNGNKRARPGSLPALASLEQSSQYATALGWK